MSKVCRSFVGVFALLYLAALALFFAGTFSLFGSTNGPLAGAFLIPLGMPWVLWIDSVTEALRPLIAVLLPGVNLFLLWQSCRYAARSRAS